MSQRRLKCGGFVKLFHTRQMDLERCIKAATVVRSSVIKLNQTQKKVENTGLADRCLSRMSPHYFVLLLGSMFLFVSTLLVSSLVLMCTNKFILIFFYRQIILLKKSQMLQKGLLSWAWTCPAWAVAMRTFLSWQSLGVGVFPFFSYLGRRHGRSQQWPSLFPHRRVGWEGELRNFGLAPFTYWGSQAARRGTQSEPSTMRTRIASFGKEQTQEPQLKHCFAVGITQPYAALPLSQSSKTRTIFH